MATKEQVRIEGVYGAPPAELFSRDAGAIQFSPLVPGARSLDAWDEATLAGLTMLAPPGTIERRYAMAAALRALAPGAEFTVLALKTKGGARLAGELEGFGCTVIESTKRHHRICVSERPNALIGIDGALTNGALQSVEATGLWAQPGIFSWDRFDPGSALLLQHLPPLAGRGADLGCGIGILALNALASPKVEHVTLIDIDRRAIEAARRNVTDTRAQFLWADVCASGTNHSGLDFVVMNPPFHVSGTEDHGLGQYFIRRAAETLRPGGVCWLTANRHLPYESVMKPLFKRITLKADTAGYKIYEALR